MKKLGQQVHVVDVHDQRDLALLGLHRDRLCGQDVGELKVLDEICEVVGS